MNFVVFLAVYILRSSKAVNSTDICNEDEIASVQCGGLGWYFGFFDKLDESCSNVECNLQCMSDLVGDCYKRPEFFTYDMVSRAAVIRMSCEDVEFTRSALKNCRATYVPTLDCMKLYENRTRTAESHKTDGNFTQYKDISCRLRKEIVNDCLEVRNVTNCSEEQRIFIHKTYLLHALLTECDQNVTLEVDEKYLQELTCDSNQTNRPATAEMSSITTTERPRENRNTRSNDEWPTHISTDMLPTGISTDMLSTTEASNLSPSINVGKTHNEWALCATIIWLKLA